MANSGVVIKITGDASDFEKELQSTQRSAKSAAASLASEYKKIGMDAPAALKRAWAEVRKAQETGSTIKIKGVETAIAQSDRLKTSLSSVNQAANNATNGVSKSAGNAGKSIEKIGDSAKDAADDVEKSSGRMARGLKTVTSVATSVASGVASVVKWVSAITLGAGIASVKYTSDIEQLQTSFEVMTGSAGKAADVIDRIRTMGAETPFEMGDLASTVQLLMNYGLTADDAMAKMSMLGDIAQGNAEKMTSIATAYGQMSSAGKVQLEDVKQMIEAGYNPLQQISEKTGESMASLYDRISKGTLAVSEITAAMEAATSAGGRYFQSMQKQSQTLSGMFSTLKDNLQQLGGDIFKPVTDNLKSTILPGTIGFIDDLSKAFKQRGMDGIIATMNRYTPKVLSSVTKMLKGALDGAASKLPMITDGLLSALPSLLEAGGELLPGLSDMFFDSVAQAIEYVSGNLPTLVPMLLKGVGKLGLSIADGLLHAVWSGVKGIGDSLKQLGLMDYGINDLWDTIMAGNDQERVETISAAIRADVDTSEAVSAIETAADNLNSALSGFGLSEDQIATITSMIGQDYAAIYAKCKEFGLDDTVASEIATKVTELNAAIGEKLKGLKVEMDPETIASLFDQANGNKTKLVEILKKMGLDDADIATITEIFDDVEGKLSERVPNLLEAIKNALTDGKADTTEVVSELQESVNGIIEEALTNNEEQAQAQIALLDPEAPDFATACANIQAKAQATADELTALQTAINEWIASAANKSTAEVQARMGELEQLMAQVLGITTQIEDAEARLSGPSAQAYQTTIAGGATDEKTIGMAIKFKFEEFKTDEQSLIDAYNQAIEEVNADSSLTPDEKVEKKAELALELEENLAANKAQYQAQLAAIFQGIADAMPDDVAQPIQEKIEQINVAQNIFDWIQGGMKGTPPDTSALQSALDSIFGEGFDIETALSQGMDPIQIKLRMTEIISELGGELAEMDFGVLGETLAAAMSEGMFDGTEFAGMEDSVAQLLALLSMTFSQSDIHPEVDAQPEVEVTTPEVDASGVAGEVTEATQTAADSAPPANTSPSVTATTTASDVDASGVTEGVESATQAAADAAPAVETTQQVDTTVETNVTSTDDSGIEDAVNTELAAQTMTVDVNAAVSLNVTVSDSNASTVGTAAGNQLGSGLVSGIASKADAASNAGTIVALSAASGARGAYGQMQAAGAYAGQGFQAGLASKRTAILATARGIANSVAATIRMALDINSPSRVMMQLGQYTGEGFEVGAVRSFQHAMRTINRSVGELNLAPRTAAPDFAGALSAAASGAYSAEASRPIYLMLNGKVLGQAVSRDIRTANNSYNRSIALGVGKK